MTEEIALRRSASALYYLIWRDAAGVRAGLAALAAYLDRKWMRDQP